MKLKEVRKEKGMSMKALAKLVGCSVSSISYFESGAKKPSYEMLLKLSEALDVSVSDLIGDDEKKPPISGRLDADFAAKYALLTDEQKAQIDDYIAFLLSKIEP